jgi:hypothetical protein
MDRFFIDFVEVDIVTKRISSIHIRKLVVKQLSFPLLILCSSPKENLLMMRIKTSLPFAALLLLTCHKAVKAFVRQNHQRVTLSHNMALDDYLSSLSSSSFSTATVLAPQQSSAFAPVSSVTRKFHVIH